MKTQLRMYTVKYSLLALSSGTPAGEGLYLTVYCLSRPYMNTVQYIILKDGILQLNSFNI